MLTSAPSRNELLSWVSGLTNTKVESLKQLSDGIQFCQVFDVIYPKVINLNKLKRDVKSVFEKEKNFRFLLNAIFHLELPVAINILDLANGKVTGIFELLEWMWREYHKPFTTGEKTDKNQSRKPGARMIKSYVGKLVNRPNQSLIKADQRSDRKKSISSGKRSLDACLKSLSNRKKSYTKSVKTEILLITQKSSNHQESQNKEKAGMEPSSERKRQVQKLGFEGFSEIKNSKQKIDVSQTKDLTAIIDQYGRFQRMPQNQAKNSSKGSSKAIEYIFKQENLDQIFQKKKESFKFLKEKKRASLTKDFELSQILKKSFYLQKKTTCKQLIKVTNAAVQNNPQLEQKLKRLLAQAEQSQKNQSPSGKRGLTEPQIIGSTNQNCSLKCETDTFEQIDFDRLTNQTVEQNQLIKFFVEPPENFNQNYEINQSTFIQKEKETVKKSSISQKETKSQNPFVLFKNFMGELFMNFKR